MASKIIKMIKYGLISETDARCLEKTIDLICDEFKNDIVRVTEIGVYSGFTSDGVYSYIKSKNREPFYIGIDNLKDKEDIKGFPNEGKSKLIIGNSNEVYNQLEDNSQHLIFVDGCHCFAHVVSDFFCYASKVKIGGYMAFHDTGKHIKPFKDFQHGDKANPDAYISVRKALSEVGLFSEYLSLNFETDKYETKLGYITKEGVKWELVFDEADPADLAGGICVFKKLY